MLRARGVSVRFGDLQAVAGLDLDVAPGEVVALMGPSGCGKTTLLRVIAGLQRPDQGTVAWEDRDLTAVPPHRRGIGLMFQDYALFPHLDVGRNVAFGLRMRKMESAAAESRVCEVLDLVGLAGYERRPIAELSGGEQQRVALARTLAPEPRLVMLDEPIGSLDRTLRDRLMIEMSELFAGLGVGVLYVTHDQTEAFAVADRIAVMRRGSLLRVATPETLWRDPRSAFVARFIGLDNVVSGNIADGTLDVGWIRVPVPPGRAGVVQAVIPPEAVRLDPNGGVEATVQTTTYRGGVYRIRVRCAEDDIELAAEQAPAPGSSVRLHIDEDRVVLLEE